MAPLNHAELHEQGKEGTMGEWSKVLTQSSASSFRNAFRMSKVSCYRQLLEDGLPCAEFEIVRVSELPTTGSTLRCDSFYLWVEDPLNNSAPILKRRNVEKENLVSLLSQWQNDHPDVEYVAIIAEQISVLYQGNLVVRKNGDMVGEIIQGGGKPLTRGDVTPFCTFERTSFLDTFKYSLRDSELRTHLFNVVRSIPKKGTGLHSEYFPGYYEFTIGTSPSSKVVRPFFYDARHEDSLLR